MDDPFDNENGSMPGISVIDTMPASDPAAAGPDNRPHGEADPAVSGTVLHADTGADGNPPNQASITVKVSMQPGNNYRAGASLIEAALTQPTILGGQTVSPQQHADALNLSGGIWSGYSTLRTWSQMLTVWRKLHVEVDSMGPVNFTNAFSSLIPAAPTFNAATQRGTIPIPDLPDDFKATDQHKVGRIDIPLFGSFVTNKTVIITTPPSASVEILSAPADIADAQGLSFTLWDDDAGSVPPFVMLGFDSPPVVLPRVPDTGLMSQLFAEAYVSVPPPDMQYYQADSAFLRNITREDQDQNAQLIQVANTNRNLTSMPNYWAVHVTSAFQGWNTKDHDPNSEPYQEGLTNIEDPWFGPPHASGSLIFHEVIREEAGAIPPTIIILEQYTVVHEVGHQFLLEHEDGYWPLGDSTNPDDDYIMTNVLGPSGMAPNVAFGARCLKKIREVPCPPQP